MNHEPVRSDRVLRDVLFDRLCDCRGVGVSKIAELTDEGKKQLEAFMEHTKLDLATAIQERLRIAMGTIYTDMAIWIESDAWINYREALRQELRGGVHRDILGDAEGKWASEVREKIFSEHREELVNALNADHLREIEKLKAEIIRLHERRTF